MRYIICCNKYSKECVLFEILFELRHITAVAHSYFVLICICDTLEALLKILHCFEFLLIYDFNMVFFLCSQVSFENLHTFYVDVDFIIRAYCCSFIIIQRQKPTFKNSSNVHITEIHQYQFGKSSLLMFGAIKIK